MRTAQNKARKVIASTPGQFEFALKRDEGTTYALPLIQDLPAKQVRRLAGAKDDAGVDMMFDLFDELAPGLTDVATQRDLALIMEAWSEASNATMGE